MERILSEEQRLYFRDSFRTARLAALRDAEAFDATTFALERFGRFVSGKEMNLNGYKSLVSKTAKLSCLAREIPKECPDYHSSFDDLYDQLREARNSAFHEGAIARHIASHAVLLSIILEDALMDGRNRIGDFMVRMPACACMWHPLSFIRQTLLANSFSYLPVNTASESEPDWQLISDCSLAIFLRSASNSEERKQRLSMRLCDVVENGIDLVKPYTCQTDASIEEVIRNCNHHPVLILSADNKQLLGIATAFDLL